MPDHGANLARAREILRAHPLIDGHNDLPWAIRTDPDAADEVEAAFASHGGLSDFGREAVPEMNRLGMLVDLSHVAPRTMAG